ncbi:serine/threonine protein kinase [Aeromicrobium piscarium]|uniref:Serine/threonine protein kinase n=1 Tax=Aeromicrobium piscarium TaxID=2590901 RepID=A0A554SH98_9ACTN|nr:serine/threonine protein kinase [Aeromicrobium piscarium]
MNGRWPKLFAVALRRVEQMPANLDNLRHGQDLPIRWLHPSLRSEEGSPALVRPSPPTRSTRVELARTTSTCRTQDLDWFPVGDELNQPWIFGTQIGGGGFARVVEATDGGGVVHAAKFVKKQPGASREMLLAELDGVRNVVPVVDSGEVGDEYVLVMPLAETSLRDHIDQAGPLSQADALAVLIDVAIALTDLDGVVVHRDIKPENVLRLNGAWCLADFGISRYADAATESGETRKHFMSGPYAAPEQWLAKHATPATDVYAFGVLAFELFEQHLPFDGMTWEDLREAHLHSDSPSMTVGPALAALVQECMFKAPEARPTAANLLARLRKAQERAADSRWSRLASANHAVVQRRAAADAETAREQTEFERRQDLFAAATASWWRISDQFHEIVNEYLSAATVVVRHDKHWSIELNDAMLGLSYPAFQTPFRPEISFDIVATSTLSLLTPKRTEGDQQWIGRSHSLYFADAFVEGEYAWFETAFMDIPMMNRTGFRDQEPFAMNDLGENALHHALGSVMGTRQIAWGMTRIDAGDCDDFLQRWFDWFASAAEGTLQRPNRMPEKDVPRNWRR